MIQGVELELDIDFGDPVTPGPDTINLPTLLDWQPVQILDYLIATVPAEKLSTAVQLGEANTRIRDHVDLYNLTGTHPVDFRQARDALLATAAYRAVNLRPLSIAVGELTLIRAGAHRISRRAGLRADGTDLPTASPKSSPPSPPSSTRSSRTFLATVGTPPRDWT